MSWRARMPREKPAAGENFVVFSIKTPGGARAEFEGRISDALALEIMKQLASYEPISK